MNIAIVGANGAIGKAFVEQLALWPSVRKIYAFSRQPSENDTANSSFHCIDLQDESSIAHAANLASQHALLDWVIVTTGVLHTTSLRPEKSFNELSAEHFNHLFSINTIGPALIAKHFLPKMVKKQRTIFAVLSARVGSITDNHLGGWYAYRASKAALNMIIKTISIEMTRLNPQSIVVGLHPGTVDSPLSKPFQKRLATHQLFTPAHAVAQLLATMSSLTPNDSGQCVAYDGKVIPP